MLDYRRPSYSDSTILPLEAHFGAPFVSTFLRDGGTHPHPVVTMRYAHHRFLIRFLEFQNSLLQFEMAALQTGVVSKFESNLAHFVLL